VVSDAATLTIQFNGGIVATGTQPQLNLPAHSNVDFTINGLNVMIDGATGDLVVALISNPTVNVQVVSNPTIIVLGSLKYPVNFNKTLTLPGLKQFLTNSVMTISIDPNNVYTASVSGSSDNPFPYRFVFTYANFEVYANNTGIGTCNEQMSAPIDPGSTTNQLSFSVDIDPNKIQQGITEVDIRGYVSYVGYHPLNETAFIHGTRLLNDMNVPVRWI